MAARVFQGQRSAHFQEKCDAAFRQEMRKNKQIERLSGSV